ncbi:SIMPL domain-containing protein [Ornithinimicrobium sufpigmenti]|uniref:SIMPL domain-containing protein n=1 Tax=Ornithinimicrobium sufpigmenti TaxID=2508882 RepID=UPI001035C688|nr:MULTISPECIES: SIMPL domain-containing protein [unclassified Ornithinimicrobium]
MDPRDTVVVTGTGRAGAAPDSLVLDLQLEGHGSTVSEALDALTEATAAAGEALPDHDLRTHGLGLHPRDDHQGRQVGHTAYQALQVRTPDPTRAGELVHRLAQATGSALGVNGLRPEVSETGALEQLARQRAVEDARGRAEQLAELCDRGLGPMLWAREVGDRSPGPWEAGDARTALASGGPAVDPADQEVQVVVEISWALRPEGSPRPGRPM